MADESNFSFDRKLNDENAIKCLKTITQMIEDGVTCKNEAEIRSYEILYNLNDGQVLLAISKLPRHLRNHEVIKFCIGTHSAVSSSNPVKFFKLMKKATYLQACILKRYIYQMRLVALKLTKVYVPGKSMIEFPMSKVMDWLYMEDPRECGKFLRSHGFEYEDDMVFIERSSFQPPEDVANQPGSYLIRAKMQEPLEQIVNGGSLGINPLVKYIPHDSFSQEGTLKEDCLDESLDVTLNSTIETTDNFENEEFVEEEEYEDEFHEDVVEGEEVEDPTYDEEEVESTAEEEFKESSYYDDVNDDNEEDYDDSGKNSEEDCGSALGSTEDTPLVENVEESKDKVTDDVLKDRIDDETNNELIEKALDTMMEELTEEIISKELNQEVRRRKDVLSLDKCFMEDIVEKLIGIETGGIVKEVHDKLKDYIARHERRILENLVDDMIMETTGVIRDEHKRTMKRRYFNLWRRNAKIISMRRKGYKEAKVQDVVEKFCHDRIVKFLLGQHCHRVSRNLQSPTPGEIIQFINLELDNLLVNLEDERSTTQEEVAKLKLTGFNQGSIPSTWSQAVNDLFVYVETMNVPGAVILRSNLEMILRDVPHQSSTNIPYLRIMSEIFCHKLMYQPIHTDVGNILIWTKGFQTPTTPFHFTSPKKRKESPCMEQPAKRSPKRPCLHSAIIKAGQAELEQSKRFEQMLSQALEDGHTTVRVSPSKARRKSNPNPSIKELREKLEEERERSLEFERRLKMFM